MSQLSTLTIDVKLGERLAVSGMAVVELLHKSGHLVRLRITAPRDVKIVREPAPERRADDVASMTE
jgi:sRNA-binding carbon storage regulator CsrA